MTTVRTLAELADALEVDFSTAWRWTQSGIPTEADGSYVVEKVDAWRRQRASNSRRRSTAILPRDVGAPALAPSSEDKRWATEYRKAKALREVLLLQELRGQVIEIDKVEDLLVARALELRRSLLALGRRLAPVLVGKDVRALQAAIDEETSRILEHYARADGVPRLQDDDGADQEAR